MPSLRILKGKPFPVQVGLLLALGPVSLLNGLLDLSAGGRRRRAFFDPPDLKLGLESLTAAAAEICAEIEPFLARQCELPGYEDIDRVQMGIARGLNPEKKWNVVLLEAMGTRPVGIERYFPRTLKLIDAIPERFQVFFSLLEAGKNIPPHEGPYRGYLRYHLGLRVPTDAPPKMRVGHEWRTWRQGEAFVFDDTWEHEVQNRSSGARVILVVDVLRPLPAPLRAINHAVRGLLRVTYARGLVRKTEAFLARWSAARGVTTSPSG